MDNSRRRFIGGGAGAAAAAGLGLGAGQAAAGSARSPMGLRLMAFLEAADEEDLALNPQAAVLRGDLKHAGEFGDLISDDYFRSLERLLRVQLARFSMIERGALTAAEQLAYDVWAYQAHFAQRQFDEGHVTFVKQLPIDHLTGQHLAFAQFSSGHAGAPYKTLRDYADGLSRIDGFVLYLKRAIERMREGLAAGRVPPRLIVLKVIAQLDQALAQPIDASPFLGPIAAMPTSFPAPEQERLRAAYRTATRDKILPAFARLRAFMAGEYLRVARVGQPGSAGMPGGRGWYEYLLEQHTTLRLPAERIHRLGLAEVARIRSEMARGQARIGFKGTLAQFFDHLKTDGAYKFATKEALFDAYEAVRQRVDRELPRLFATLPASKLDFAAVPAEQEASASGAYYIVGTPEGDRPGVFYLNTSDLPSRTLVRTTALYLHEGLPGHHLQGSLAQEDASLPPTLRFGWNAGYGEGWALYAEWLGHEMGLYGDALQHVGQLDMEMFRAARLVVDTGLHARRWSRTRAVDYLVANTSLERSACEQEVDRYIAWPGQACAYKLGELTLRDLRRKAEHALGTRFDVRAFHTQVLGTGALPLGVLRRKITAWIAAGGPADPPKGTTTVMSTNTSTTTAAAAAVQTTTGSGRAGDFHFLAGRWSIKNRRLKQRWVPANAQDWETFDGDSQCWDVLGMQGSIEELRIPVGQPRGMGIRLLDVKKGLWSDYWVGSGAGEIVPPPMWGEFKDGVGTFIAPDERDGDIAVQMRGVWDRITPTSCRWHQAFSRDGGKTWEDNWFMDWTRIG